MSSKENNHHRTVQKYISGELVRIPRYDSPMPLERFMQMRRYYLIGQLIQKYSSDINDFLDAGCGTGVFMSCLPENVRAIGIDLYKDNLNKARARNSHVSYIQADVVNMPLKNNSIDLCLYSEVIEHLSNPNQGIMEIKRVVKDDGWLIISTPSKFSVYENKEFVYLRRFIFGIRRLLKGNSFKIPFEPHISLHSRRELKRKLTSAGFKIIEKHYTGFCFPLGGELLNILLKVPIFWTVYQILDRGIFKFLGELSWSIVFVCKLTKVVQFMEQTQRKVKNHPKEQIKLAIIGCGAVAQERYLPASKLVSNLEVTHVVDANIERAKEIAGQFQVPDWTNDYREIFGKVDAAVVATPPNLHAPIGIDCLTHGVHVLCEKPMAISVNEAQEMVKASQNGRTHLAIGMNRRLCPSSQLANLLIRTGLIGKLGRFEVEEGYEFNWPLQSVHLFVKEASGGGVLAGTGSHLLDLLFWFIGKDAEIITYVDDNFGGVEANARVELTLKHNGEQIPGVVELSLTRNLRNTIRIFGERGYIDIPTLGAEGVYFHPGSNSEQVLEVRVSNIHSKGRVKEFAEQLSRFADSILTGEIKYVPGTEAIPVIKCIEQCYNMREAVLQPWEMKDLGSTFSQEL